MADLKRNLKYPPFGYSKEDMQRKATHWGGGQPLPPDRSHPLYVDYPIQDRSHPLYVDYPMQETPPQTPPTPPQPSPVQGGLTAQPAQPAPTPQAPQQQTGDIIYRGTYKGVPTFTNIPEHAAAMGLTETMQGIPDTGGGAYIEMDGDTGRYFAIKARQPQEQGGTGRSYEDKIRARKNLDNYIMQNNIPMKEAMELQKYWGLDEASIRASETTARTVKTGAEEEKWVDWGYGQKRNTKTGQVAEVPVEPETATKLTAEQGKKQDAQKRVAGNLTAMRDLYDILDKMGAIPSTEAGTFDNVIARASSSWLGQASANAMATQAQSIRNQINQMRPLLINDIRQAAEMGARGMDSEKELEFYLQAATDTTKDVQANRAALNVLSAAYGLGDPILSAEDRAKKEQGVQQAKEAAIAAGLTPPPPTGEQAGVGTGTGGGVAKTVRLPDGSVLNFDASGRQIE